jgi:hypothetical protein
MVYAGIDWYASGSHDVGKVGTVLCDLGMEMTGLDYM